MRTCFFRERCKIWSFLLRNIQKKDTKYVAQGAAGGEEGSEECKGQWRWAKEQEAER